jgi:diguanylate cyclase (GGDEF)-like protein
MKLRTKASLFLSILLAAIFLGQAIYFYYFLEKTLLSQAHHRQEEIVKLLGDRLDAGIRSAQNDLLSIAAHLDFQWLKEKNSGLLESYLHSALNFNSDFDNGYFILDGQGRGLADYPAGADFRGQDFSFREYFQKTRDEKRPVISKTYVSRRTGAPVITFTAPLRSYDGNFFGLMAGSMNLLRDNMFGVFKGNRIGQTGKILIYDSAGKLIFHPDPGIILNQSRLAEYRITSQLFLQKGKGTIYHAGREGGAVWISFHRMASTDWIVALQTESREILAPLEALRKEVALALLLALAAAIGLGIWGMGILVRPIQALSRSIEQFKGGIWEEPPGLLDRSDEIGELGQEFKEMSIKRRRIEKDLQEKKEQLEFHYALSEEVNRSLDLNTLLNRAVEMITTKSNVPMIGILILNEGTKELEHLVRFGYPEDYTRDVNKIPLGQGASGQAARTGESLVIPDYSRYPQALPALQEKGGIGSMAVFPLKMQDRVIGILNVADPEPQAFSPDKIDFFQQLAPILAGAINNARIHQQTQLLNQALVELSRMDGLTGAFNRRYLEERLSEEINRCRRHGGYLGLMMIDVDHFKQINDTFGHGVGDQVLKEVADLIQKSCRNIDIVGRYGGDEFLVILIETTEPEALKIAERIQQKTREVTIPPHNPQIGLSIGVASQNGDYEGILKKADDRMYAQKRLDPLHS